MIIYRLEGNTVVAEFDWVYKYTCPSAQWYFDISKFVSSYIGHTNDIVIRKIINRKTSFCGKAKFDDITTLEEAKNYAKNNLLKKYHHTLKQCVIAIVKNTIKYNNRVLSMYNKVGEEFV